MSLELVLNEATYERVLLQIVPSARKFLWIATADLKDLHVRGAGGSFVPFVKTLGDLVSDGVHVRLFHAKEPLAHPILRRDEQAPR